MITIDSNLVINLNNSVIALADETYLRAGEIVIRLIGNFYLIMKQPIGLKHKLKLILDQLRAPILHYRKIVDFFKVAFTMYDRECTPNAIGYIIFNF